MAFRREYAVDTRIVRIFNTYGPRMRPEDGRVIPNFFVQALKGKPLTLYGDGKQTRSFCYIRDEVEGIFALMQSKEFMPVNIGNPTEFSMIQIAEKINQLTGNRAGMIFKPLPTDDPIKRKPDISRAKEILGWAPKYDLQKGLELTHDYFKSIV